MLSREKKVLAETILGPGRLQKNEKNGLET